MLRHVVHVDSVNRVQSFTKYIVFCMEPTRKTLNSHWILKALNLHSVLSKHMPFDCTICRKLEQWTTAHRLKHLSNWLKFKSVQNFFSCLLHQHEGLSVHKLPASTFLWPGTGQSYKLKWHGCVLSKCNWVWQRNKSLISVRRNLSNMYISHTTATAVCSGFIKNVRQGYKPQWNGLAFTSSWTQRWCWSD